jgi:anti-sigma B factor antagonist
VGALKRARTHAGEFVVVCSRDRLLQLFEVTGLDAILRVVGRVEDVLDL